MIRCSKFLSDTVEVNIVLYQGAASGSLLAFVSKRMLSIIISMKGNIRNKNEQ